MKLDFNIRNTIASLKSDKSIAILKLGIAIIGLVQAIDVLKNSLEQKEDC